jgi:hypothetical protein
VKPRHPPSGLHGVWEASSFRHRFNRVTSDPLEEIPNAVSNRSSELDVLRAPGLVAPVGENSRMFREHRRRLPRIDEVFLIESVFVAHIPASSQDASVLAMYSLI